MRCWSRRSCSSRPRWRAAKERAPGAAGVGAGRGARAARAGGGLEPGADGPGGDVLHGAEAAVWRVSRAATLCRWGALGFVALGRSAGADGLSVPALRAAVLELAKLG